MKVLLPVVLLFFARQACADLYRWVEPDSGSVKLSSYPPPWYNESAPDRRKPKVERIPDKSAPTPFSSAGAGGGEVAALEDQRRAALLMMEATLEAPARPGTDAEMQRQMGLYRELSQQLDRLDPAGTAARNRELQRLAEKLVRRSQQ